MRVGLWGPAGDASLEMVKQALHVRGMQTVVVAPETFPEEVRLTVGAGGLLLDGEPLHTVGAWYCREGSLMSPVPAWVPSPSEWATLSPSSLADQIRAAQEARSVRASLLRLLAEGRAVVNPPSCFRLRALLPALLRGWKRNGLAVADFVSGNDLERIAHFVAGHHQSCRARRLDMQPASEQPADFDYLKRHHLDLDRHPLLVRAARSGAALMRALVVDGECLQGLRDSSHGADRPRATALGKETRALAVRACEGAGAKVAEVTLEVAADGGRPLLLDLDPAPDLALWPDRSAREGAASAVAELLVRAALAGAPSAKPAPQPALPGPRAERPRVGIAGRVGDSEAAALASALEQRDVEPVPLELPLFPHQRAIHEAPSDARMARCELASLDAVFLRTTGYRSALPSADAAAPGPDAWTRMYPAVAAMPADQGECFRFKYAMLEVLGARVPVINPPSGQEVHRHKVWQVLSLERAGLPVPETLTTNDLAAARAFVDRLGGPSRVVAKPLAGIYKTCLVSEAGLDTLIARGPLILQRYVRGDTLRTYIVDGRLVGAGRILHSGRSVDSSVEQRGVEQVELDPATVARGWAAAQHLGLAWTGMDFQRDADTGECYILECNASAMFAAFSRQTGCDVPGALANLLLRLAAHARRAGAGEATR